MWRSLLPILLVVLVGCGPMGKKPTGTLDRYVAAQPVVSQRDMARLAELLRKGDMATFNQVRTNAPYTGMRLDFRGASLAGLRLVGANLSNSILANVNLTGANLSNACFRSSYLATARVDADLPGAPFTNRTCLANCDFTGAILKATEYIILAGDPRPWEFIDVWTKTEPRLDLGKADIAGARGIDFSIPDPSRFKVAGTPTGPSLTGVLAAFLTAIELAAIALGALYLYHKHLQRWCRVLPQEDPRTWTGHGLEASKLKPHLEAVRRDHLAACPRRGVSRFHQHWFGFTRRAVLRLRYFRHGESNEEKGEPLIER